MCARSLDLIINSSGLTDFNPELRQGLATNVAAESMQVSPIALLTGCRSVKGWYSGTSIDSQDALAFSARTGVRPMSEAYPLE